MSDPFTWVFTDVNGEAKEIAGDPVHRSPQDLRIYTALYAHPASRQALEGEPIGFLQSSGVSQLSGGHPAKLYPIGATPSPFESSTLVYTHPARDGQDSVAGVNKASTGEYEFYPSSNLVDIPNGMHKLYTHPASADVPDLFWNCGDIDSGDRGIDHVVSVIADGMDLSSTDTFPIMRAKRLSDCDVCITVDSEGDVQWKWAEPKQEQGQ